MRTILILAVIAFGVALYVYPLSTIMGLGTAVGQHLIEQAQR